MQSLCKWRTALSINVPFLYENCLVGTSGWIMFVLGILMMLTGFSCSMFARREDGGSGRHLPHHPAHSTQPNHSIGPQLCACGDWQCQSSVLLQPGLLWDNCHREILQLSEFSETFTLASFLISYFLRLRVNFSFMKTRSATLKNFCLLMILSSTEIPHTSENQTELGLS